MRSRLLPLAALGLVSTAFADITLDSGPVADRASNIAGFKLRVDAPVFMAAFSGGDTALPAESVRLVAVTLTTRDKPLAGAPPPTGRPTEALHLKVYADKARTRLLGTSLNTFHWNPPVNVEHLVAQTYRFENTTIPVSEPVYFTFETADAPKSPLGAAALSFCNTRHGPNFAALFANMTDAPISTPALTLTLRTSDAPAPVAGTVKNDTPPTGASGRTGALLALGLFTAAGLGAFVVVKRRKPAARPPVAPRFTAVALPPPPGQ